MGDKMKENKIEKNSLISDQPRTTKTKTTKNRFETRSY